MARPKRHRVDGPYKHGRRWRVRLVTPTGQTSVESFATEAEARERAAAARLTIPGGVSLAAAADDYLASIKARGLRPATIVSTRKHLATWTRRSFLLEEVTPEEVARWYQRRQQEVAVDSHQQELAQARRFFAWCVERGKLSENPAAGVKPVGRKKRGKPQLRIGEAQRLSRSALELARGGDEGAIAVLAVLWLGLRSGELLARVVRDLDVFDGGCWLWIDAGKTEQARRHLDVPGDLAALLQQQARGKLPGAYLFGVSSATGHHTHVWLNRAVERLCAAAGVPRVPPHGLRGTWASIAEEAGAVAHLVSQQLGHSSHAITAAHYVAPGSSERAAGRRVLQVISGTGNPVVPVPAEKTEATRHP